MNASFDENGVRSLLAASSSDGTTPIRVRVNMTFNALEVSDGTTGTDFGRNVAYRDENDQPVLMAVSSADGVTPVEVYADTSGNLLIQTT